MRVAELRRRPRLSHTIACCSVRLRSHTLHCSSAPARPIANTARASIALAATATVPLDEHFVADDDRWIARELSGKCVAAAAESQALSAAKRERPAAWRASCR